MKRTDIKPIGQVIREHLQRLDESGKQSETIALTAVDDVLGKEFASLIKDRRIENGVLLLKTDSASLRSELFASRSQLMQKLNEKTGKNIIKDVRIN